MASKKMTPRALEQEAERLRQWEARIADREKAADDSQKRRDERHRAQDEERQKVADDLKDREAKVARAEQDAEVGAAVRTIGRALIEGAFTDADGRHLPPLARVIFGRSPWGPW